MENIKGKAPNLKVNAILNVIKSCLSIIFPLITAPYVNRVLGASGVGQVSYVTSIITYFTLLAMLGVSSYAIREGAKRRGNQPELNGFLSEVFTVNILTTLLAYVLLFFTVLLIPKFHSYTTLFIILSFSILFQTFSVDWLNTIFEDFVYLTVRSIAIYIIHVVLIFVFIKSEDDYYLYAILQVLSSGIICVSNWIYCRKFATLRIVAIKRTYRHLKPLLILFANAVMISLYVNFDSTMLGWFKDDTTVGLYSVSVKVYAVVKAIMIAIYAVTIPRLATLFGKKLENDFKSLYSHLISYISLLLLPTGTGIICLSKEIIVFMGGDKYVDASVSLQILGGALIFAIYGGLVTACLNITIGREKDNLLATIISAFINFTLNLYFIPRFSLNGAAFTTLLSEAFVFLFCFIRLPEKKNYIEYNYVSRNVCSSIIGSLIILFIISFLRWISNSTVFILTFGIIASVTCYGLYLMLIKNSIFIEETNKIKNRLIKK